MQKVIIIGAGGQSKNTSFVIEQTGKFEIIGFADDDSEKKGTTLRNYSVLGSLEEILIGYDDIGFVFAIGNPDVVEKLVQKIKEKIASGKKFIFPNIIHPSVNIDFNEVQLGVGNVIFPDCLFLSEVKVGDFNFFNFKSAVSHESIIGDFCIVQPGVNLLGQTTLKDKAYCGANATIIQGRTVGRNATIGAGAVVTKDVEDNAIVVGNPAKLLRYKEE
jgi:sugar O-acyltransferase (sialic acid O-acetyltransferase NeuD family)